MIYEAEGIKMAVLAVVGINLAGEREVLGFTTGDAAGGGYAIGKTKALGKICSSSSNAEA